MIQGRAKFDAIALGEGSFSFLGSTIHLEGKAAFVSARSGDTHGWTKNTNWSPAVIEKLSELRALMEVDLGQLHLEDGGEALSTAARRVPVAGGPGGLSEHLATEKVPSV